MRRSLSEREKRLIHFALLLVVLGDCVVVGHASAADYSFLTLAVLLEVGC